jgi:hypothetical protein
MSSEVGKLCIRLPTTLSMFFPPSFGTHRLPKGVAEFSSRTFYLLIIDAIRKGLDTPSPASYINHLTGNAWPFIPYGNTTSLYDYFLELPRYTNENGFPKQSKAIVNQVPSCSPISKTVQVAFEDCNV